MKFGTKDERELTYRHRTGGPVSDWERENRLSTDRRANSEIYEVGNVYHVDSTCLVISDDSQDRIQRVGTAALVCIAASAFFLFFGANAALSPWTDPPEFMQRNGYWVGTLLCAVLGFSAAAFFGFIVCGVLRRYAFTLTHRPIRLNRKTRRIYAMRTKDADGIWEIPWDNSEFFCIGKRRVGGLSRSYPMYDIRHYQLDADGNIVRGFVLGQLMLSLELAQQQWEYYRRYMEHGPAGLPDPHRFWAPRESFREGFRISRGDICPGVLSFSNVVFFPFQLIDAICRWLMLATCSDPVWPEPIDAACKPEPNDPYARPYADDFVGFASGPYGRPSREDLERMWKQQDKRRFEGALTRVEAEALIRQAAARPLDPAVQ